SNTPRADAGIAVPLRSDAAPSRSESSRPAFYAPPAYRVRPTESQRPLWKDVGIGAAGLVALNYLFHRLLRQR
ncbi:MAG: hypothetical protein ACRECQ_01575, partial [Burkholderiaceae bacterium]